jgi:predicted DNA-binding transcriptional regulator AlpA
MAVGTAPRVQRSRDDTGPFFALAEVCRLVGMCRASVNKLMEEGRFPTSVKVSHPAVRRRTDAALAWEAEKRRGFVETLPETSSPPEA